MLTGSSRPPRWLPAALGLVALLAISRVEAGEERAAEGPWIEVNAYPGISAVGGKALLVPVPVLKGGAVLHVPGREDVPLPGSDWRADGQHQAKLDPTRRLAAYRSDKGPWRLVYLGSEGRHFVTREWLEGAPDWSRAPRFSKVARDLFETDDEEYRSQVLAELGEREGPAAVAELLLDTAPLFGHELPGTAWEGAFARLPSREQGLVKSGLRLVLTSPKPQPRRLVRALMHVELPPDAYVDALRARLLELAEVPQDADHAWAAAVVLRRLMEVDAAKAADAGCGALGAAARKGEPGFNAGLSPDYLAAAALAVVRGKQPCAVLRAHLAENACQQSLRCEPDGPNVAERILGGYKEPLAWSRHPVCEREELENEVSEVLAQPLALGAKGLQVTRLALLHAHRLGLVPPELERRNDRRRYVLDGAREPECDGWSKGQKRCKCPEPQVREAACRAPLEEGRVRLAPSCELRIDDATDEITTAVIEGK